MIIPIWAKIGAGVILLLGAYIGGRIDGTRIEQGAQLRADRKANEVRIELQGAIEDSSIAHGTAETARQTNVREIYRETQKIIDRPVYSTVCIDGDGLRLLDAATDVANGKRQPEPAGAAPGVPATSANGSEPDGRDGLSAIH